MKYDVIVIGSYSVDLVFSGLEVFPRIGEEVYSRDFAMLPGESFNAAVGMHRLGLKVGWAGDFGTDELSQYTLEKAHQEGLDDALFVIHNRSLRRVSVSASFAHDRGFITFYDPDPQIPAALPALAKASARVLYIPGLYYGPFLDAGVQLARLKKMKLVMDGNTSSQVSIMDEQIKKALQSLDVFSPNAREARLLTGESDLNTALLRLGELCPLVVIKDGANGSHAIRGGEVVHVPALPLTCVDTTGAGDLFNAGFLRAWLDGLRIEECLRWGNVTGGLSTLALGATGYKITLEEVRKTIKHEYYRQ